jgi:hypothetical protein
MNKFKNLDFKKLLQNSLNSIVAFLFWKQGGEINPSDVFKENNFPPLFINIIDSKLEKIKDLKLKDFKIKFDLIPQKHVFIIIREEKYNLVL